MVVGIIGTRKRNSEKDKKLIKEKLELILSNEKDIIICSGGCSKGGDKFAEELASEFRLKKKIYKADWDRLGKGAGFLRNTDIAMESDILIACVADNRKGGTEDTIKKFKKFHPEGELILV